MTTTIPWVFIVFITQKKLTKKFYTFRVVPRSKSVLCCCISYIHSFYIYAYNQQVCICDITIRRKKKRKKERKKERKKKRCRLDANCSLTFYNISLLYYILLSWTVHWKRRCLYLRNNICIYKKHTWYKQQGWQVFNIGSHMWCIHFTLYAQSRSRRTWKCGKARDIHASRIGNKKGVRASFAHFCGVCFVSLILLVL